MPTDQPIGAGSAVPALQARVVSLALAVMAAACVAQRVLGFAGAEVVATVAYAGFALAAIGGQGRRIKLLFAVAAALSLVVMAAEEAAAALLARAFGMGAFLASFLLLLGLLREAAETSPAVRACGAFVTRQPPGRRYLALHAAGHLFGILLNFGVLSLFGPMIRQGVAAATAQSGEAHLQEVRERRQLSALLRGFSWIIVWSPTTVTQALLLSVLPAAEPRRLMLLGLAAMGLVFLAGWLEDRVRWRALRRRRAAERTALPTPPPAPAAALGRMALVCLLLIAAVVLTQLAFGVATVPALMLSVPCFALAWIPAQHAAAGPGPALRQGAGRFRLILRDSFPAASPEILTLSLAGTIGTLAAALIPTAQVAGFAAWAGGAPLLLLAGVMLLIVLAAQLALSPIMFVVFLGAALTEAAIPGLDQTLLGLALAAGWALSLTSSPFTASVLVLSRATGIDGRRIAWSWNLGFSALAYLAVVLVFALALA